MQTIYSSIRGFAVKDENQCFVETNGFFIGHDPKWAY
jgi:hypothetical protein